MASLKNTKKLISYEFFQLAQEEHYFFAAIYSGNHPLHALTFT